MKRPTVNVAAMRHLTIHTLFVDMTLVRHENLVQPLEEISEQNLIFSMSMCPVSSRPIFRNRSDLTADQGERDG